MSSPDRRTSAVPTRREPPRFRPVTVGRVERLTPRMVRLTFTGPELEGLAIEEPAASVRLLLPPPGADELVMPTWNRNEFLLPDGRRPAIRTFTPRRTGVGEQPELDLEIVIHDGGAASTWADGAEPGAPAAISGPGRGYTIEDAPAFWLGGDETAIPAISQLLEALPDETPVQVHVEMAHPDARLTLPAHPRAEVWWHDLPAGAPPGDTLVAAVQDADIAPDSRVWAAGEAAGVQRVRRHLFDDRGLSRHQAVVRGYWKHGRTGA